MKNKQIIKDNKRNPIRDYRSVKMTNTTPTLQSIRAATKSRAMQTRRLAL
ncbi:MAG: hypothetical protein LBT56_06415 [Prevotellaceae bacterium]|jgi:hypothetical protein|nr:hypothetical protein [Prevotellaceae bacterium]